MTTLPPELVVGDVVLRRPDPQDAAAVTAAVNDSLAHLAPWMAWAQRPAEVEATALRLALSRAAFDAGGDGVWTIFEPGGGVVGSCGLHDRVGPAAREIGYWVRVGWTGQEVASRAAAALVRVAFEVLSMERVEVHCDVANERSAAVARRLGFTHVRSRPEPPGAPGDSGRSMVWVMRRETWWGSPAAAYRVEVPHY